MYRRKKNTTSSASSSASAGPTPPSVQKPTSSNASSKTKDKSTRFASPLTPRNSESSTQQSVELPVRRVRGDHVRNGSENVIPSDDIMKDDRGNDQTAYDRAVEDDVFLAPLPVSEQVTAISDTQMRDGEVDRRVMATGRLAVATQTQNLPARAPPTAPDRSLTGPFIKALADLGVVLHKDDTGQLVFYLGEMIHADLISKIAKEWGTDPAVTAQRVSELKDQLDTDDIWRIFLLPCKNVNGVQDTVIRALILSSVFQTETFNLIYRRLDAIGRSLPADLTPAILNLVEMLISQFRFITQVFNSRALYVVVFDRNFSHWEPAVRDQFISVIPELFTDNNVHPDTANKLVEFMFTKGLSELPSLRTSCLHTLKVLDVTYRVRRNIQLQLIRSLMYLETVNIPLTIETVLQMMHKTDSIEFGSFLLGLHNYLDIARLKRLDAENTSLSLAECVGQSVHWIAEFLRFNPCKAQSDLIKFLSTPLRRSRRDAVIPQIAGFEEEADDERDQDDTVDDPTFDPRTVAGDDDDDSQVGDGGLPAIREFDILDVLLVLALNEAKGDSLAVIKEIRKQVSMSYDSSLSIKQLFQEALEFEAVGSTFFYSSLRLARELCQSPNSQLTSIGSVIYKTQFINQPSFRSDVLISVISHLSELDLETSVALEILEGIAERETQLLRPFLVEMNALLDNLDILSIDNVRRLFFVLVSVNLYKDAGSGVATQANRQVEGGRFLNRLHLYLESDVQREVIWGVIGLVQYIKALLMFSRNPVTNQCGSDTEILTILQKLDSITKRTGGVIRSEFFHQVSEILKPMKQVGESHALKKFGTEFIDDIREKLFVDISADEGPLNASTPAVGQYDSEQFVNLNTNTWVKLSSLVMKEDVEAPGGQVLSLISMLQVAKDFAMYHDSFGETDSDSTEDDHRQMFWKRVLFLLTSNIDLSDLSITANPSHNERLRMCHALYVTVEYIRTLLNVFGDCRLEHSDVQECLQKKLYLMLCCEAQLKVNIRKLGSYKLLRLTRHNKCEIIVTAAKDRAVPKKTAGRPKKSLIASTAPAGEGDAPEAADETTAMVIDGGEPSNADEESMMHVVDDDDEATGDQGVSEANDVTQTESQVSEGGMAESFKLRKGTTQRSIGVDQIQWYCTPLGLETVTRLIETIGMLRRYTLSLVEILHVMLKYAMPAAGKNSTPPGFCPPMSAPMPLATMDYGSKDVRWKVVASAIPGLFDILCKTVENFTTNTAQAVQPGSSSYMQEMANLLRFCVMIFSRIFQTREIAAAVDPQDSERLPVVKTRREMIMAVLNHAIGVFDASKLPHAGGTGQRGGDGSTRASVSSAVGNSRGHESDAIGFSFGGSSHHDADATGSSQNSSDVTVIDFFLNIAPLVPSIEAAAAMMALLRTFEHLTDYHVVRCASLALLYLNREYDDEQSGIDASSPVEREKNALAIVNDYLALRSDAERIPAITWFISHQLMGVFSQSGLERAQINVGELNDDREEIVGDFKEVVFPCINKRSFSAFHRLLFKHFNDNVLRYLRTANKDLQTDTQAFVKSWNHVIEAFYLLTAFVLVKEYRPQVVLTTLAREGKRFLNFVVSRQSTLAALLRDKDRMTRHAEMAIKSVRRVQLASRNLQGIRTFAKERKNATLMKLLPELHTTNEKMIRELQAIATQGGYSNAFKIGFMRNRTIDGDVNDVSYPPSEATSSASRTPNKRRNQSRPSDPGSRRTTFSGSTEPTSSSTATAPPPSKRGRKRVKREISSTYATPSSAGAPEIHSLDGSVGDQ